MESPRRVVLLGNSVIVATVGVSLRRSPRDEVISLSGTQLDQLERVEPDVVIFDLEAARPEAAFSLLERRPSLLVIGISPDRNQVRTWSGRQLRELSMQDLVGVINGPLQGAEEGRREPLKAEDKTTSSTEERSI